VFMTVFVGFPFCVIAVRARASRGAAVASLYVAAGAFAVSTLVAAEWRLVLGAGVIVVETLVVAGTPFRHHPELTVRHTSKPLVAAVLVGIIPWTGYALSMWALNRQSRPDTDITVGTDHYSVQGAWALALLGLVAVAALWPAGRRLLGVEAGVSAVYLGIISWRWHPTPGSLTPPWSALAALWGVAVVASSCRTRPRAPLAPGALEVAR
jgi:hypothetical protein